MKKMVTTIAALGCCLSPHAFAQDISTTQYTPLIEMSAGIGGDTLVELFFTNGESQDIDAGDGVTLSAGFNQQFVNGFGVRYAIGYKFSTSAAENYDVWKSAIPVDVVPYYRTGEHRIGAGLTYHLSPELDLEGLGTAEFDNATGYVVEYGYRIFSIAYTGLDYSIGGLDYDASNIGMRVAWEF